MLRTPDWDHWSQMRKTELWEIVALSCDIEPRSTDHSRINRRGSNEYATDRASYLGGRSPADLYQSRFDIALSWLGVDLIPLSGTRSTASLDITISARWACDKGWLVPSDFRSIGARPAAVLLAAPTPPVDDADVSTTNNIAIPGKLPSTTVGRLAVKVAWKIEEHTHRRAIASEVMPKLIATAKTGTDGTLFSVGKDGRGVVWVTVKGKEKNYSMEALQQTLETWHGTRG